MMHVSAVLAGRQAGGGGARGKSSRPVRGAPMIGALPPGKGVAKEAPGIPSAFRSCVPIIDFFFKGWLQQPFLKSVGQFEVRFCHYWQSK